MKKTNKSLPVEIVSQPEIKPTDLLRQYNREISRYPLLNREEEFKWSKIYYETKNREALRVLVQSNLRFVVKIASEYSKFGSRLVDLIQEGNMGLLKAINEFNPYKGVRLITYAVWWIRGAIQEYLMKQHSIVRIGTTPNQKKLFYQLRKEHLPPVGVTDSTRLIESKTGISPKEINSMRERLSARDVSLDHSTEPYEKMVASNSLDEQYAQEQEIQMLKKEVRKLRPSLNEKETYILDHRILSDNPQTLQTIGEHFNVTREAVRQAESKLLKKIKERVTLQK
ncbi:MAG: sigma-70 family RNA polymerase sigma factor [Bdellovibrionales bacterium]|nr:sigma-70 family RNA polymerase sigma factor [Bdellovibrionales bacterium]